MSLESRLTALTVALGADVRTIKKSYVPLGTDAMESARSILSTSRRRPLKVLVLGHSYVAGIGADRPENRWVNQLALKLQASYPSGIPGFEHPVRLLSDGAAAVPLLPGVAVVNGGISGAYSNSYTPSGTLTNVTTLQPEIVIHMIGVNDYGLGVPKASYKTWLAAAIDAVSAACTISPVHILVDQFAAPLTQNPTYPWTNFMEAMRELAEERPSSVGYVNANKAFVVAQASGYGAPDPFDLIHSDLLHPSNEGHALLAQIVGQEMRLPPAPGLRTPEAFDRFNRPVLGNLETGQPWVVHTGTWTPTPTGLYPSTTGQVVTNVGFSDCEVSTILYNQSGVSCQLVLKSASDTTGLRVMVSQGGDNVVVNNGTTLVAYSAAGLGLVANRDYHLAAQIKDGVLTVYLDGKLVYTWAITASIVTALAANTMHGLRVSTNANIRFKNFAIRRV